MGCVLDEFVNGKTQMQAGRRVCIHESRWYRSLTMNAQSSLDRSGRMKDEGECARGEEERHVSGKME